MGSIPKHSEGLAYLPMIKIPDLKLYIQRFQGTGLFIKIFTNEKHILRFTRAHCRC